MSNRLKNRFESFEEAPQKEVWDNIKSQIPKPKFNFLAAFTISGAAILVFGIIILLVYTPTSRNEKQVIVSENTNNLNKEVEKTEEVTISNNNQTIDINKVDEEISKPIINNVSDDNNIVKSNQSTQSNSNTAATEKKTQIKETEKSSSKITYPFIANQIKALSRSNQSIETNNQIEEKVVEVIDDTILTRRFLFIPNAFTPTKNDNNVFKPAYTKVKNYEMKIFNRSGVLLFSSKDILMGWNGYYKGRLCEMGAYVYVIKCENMEGNSCGQEGLVNLIR